MCLIHVDPISADNKMNLGAICAIDKIRSKNIHEKLIELGNV